MTFSIFQYRAESANKLYLSELKRKAEKSTIFNLDFRARFVLDSIQCTCTTQMINVRVILEYLAGRGPPIGRLYSLRKSNLSSYYGRLLMSLVKGDEVGSISSQSTTGSLTASVMNCPTVDIDHVRPLKIAFIFCFCFYLEIFRYPYLIDSSKYRKLVFFPYK